MSETNKISWSVAKQLILNYQSSANTNTLTATPASLGTLKGFRASKSTIEGILNYVDENGNSPVEIGMFFGINPSDSSATIVLAGIDENNEIMKDSAYDFCEPCPNNCANNYPTS